MSFLPDGYKIPKQPSNYMKFEEGPNKFRILSKPILGFEYWNKENKPVRMREIPKLYPTDMRADSKFKHFWAMAVWNYNDARIQILQITQSTIQRGLKIKIDNREGKFDQNDFTITREGEGLDSVYDIDVSEATPVDPEITKLYEAKNIDLEALYDGGDPFGGTKAQEPVTPQNIAPRANPETIGEEFLPVDPTVTDPNDIPF